MLILTRKPREKILIGDDIEIMVMEVNGNQVRIGINAPRQLPIHREEVYLRIREEESLALKTDSNTPRSYDKPK